MDDDITGGRTVIRLDEKAVRVLAHPLRSRLLSRLRLHGPATATELAASLATNTGATSYHLRALESVGLVIDTGDGAGKRRLWRAATDAHSWGNADFADDEDARTALGWLQRDYMRRFAQRAENWLDMQESWPPEWMDATGLGDDILILTAPQAREMKRDLDALLDRYRQMGAGDPGAERLHVFFHMSPVDPERAPGTGDDQ